MQELDSWQMCKCKEIALELPRSGCEAAVAARVDWVRFGEKAESCFLEVGFR